MFNSRSAHVTEYPLKLVRSRARRDFKQRSGHTVQHLLTLVVGVDAVKQGAKAPESLPARWDPTSKEDAADRARTFANQAALLWTVESVVAYVSELVGAKPSIVDDPLTQSVRHETDKAKKLTLLAIAANEENSADLALVLSAFVWRHRVVHVGARNQISGHVRQCLELNSAYYERTFQGLRVGEMVDRIDASKPPRLKEATAVVRAAGFLVKRLDEHFVSNVDPSRYLEDLLTERLTAERPSERLRNAKGLWDGSEERAAQAIMRFALQNGMSPSPEAPLTSDVARLTPREAVARFVGIDN